MVLVAGGDSRRLGVDLLVNERRVRSVRGERREILRPVFMRIGRWRGQWGRVVIRDHHTQPWGHIAVDEIHQMNGPAPGVSP